MGIAVTAPRGGLAESLAGAPRTLILRNGEIERYEDQHGGIFQAWDGFMGDSEKPNSTQVRDIVSLGLVGGGMADAKADALVSGLGPDQLVRLYTIAHALVGVAFMPDAADDGGDEPQRPTEDKGEKKT